MWRPLLSTWSKLPSKVMPSMPTSTLHSSQPRSSSPCSEEDNPSVVAVINRGCFSRAASSKSRTCASSSSRCVETICMKACEEAACDGIVPGREPRVLAVTKIARDATRVTVGKLDALSSYRVDRLQLTNRPRILVETIVNLLPRRVRFGPAFCSGCCGLPSVQRRILQLFVSQAPRSCSGTFDIAQRIVSKVILAAEESKDVLKNFRGGGCNVQAGCPVLFRLRGVRELHSKALSWLFDSAKRLVFLHLTTLLS